MANVIPFNGYRFNQDKIDDLGLVMAPPYDTISEEEQNKLYSANDYNVVRLNKGVKLSGDSDINNCFTRASSHLEEWISKNVLVKDENPCFYLYEQEVTYKNTTFKNLGLVGLLELEDLNSGNIMQCEKPNEDRKPARYELLKNTQSNFSMINCIYMEYEKALMNKLKEISEDHKPDMEFKTHENIIGEDVSQRVWVISDAQNIKFIQKALKKQTFFIADGQTRYEVSLAYKKECEKNNPNHTGKEGYNYIMTLFTNAFDDGLIQLPVHRLIKSKKKFFEDFFIACAQDYFKIEKIIVDIQSQEFVDTMKKQIATTRSDVIFALYCGGNYFYRLTFTGKEALKAYMPDASEDYRSLDTTVMNYIVFGDLLDMDKEQVLENVEYTTRSSVGEAKVKSGEASCMFVLNPVRANQICGVANAHERMPEKSIFIFPKASTGVVIYKMED